MMKKTFVILLILCLPLSGLAWADSGSSSGPVYFLNETAVIIADIVLFPFRLIRDIFDPQPLPPRPVMMAYPYSPYVAPTVVAAPSMVPAAAPAVAPSAPVAALASDPLEVSIPNGDGSYTSITLTKTDKGFMGPQGEFYADHPTEEQLKARYMKK